MTLANYKIGAAYVSLGGTDLGATKGAVEFTLEQMQTQITSTQFHEVFVDEVVNGKKCVIKVPFYEVNLEALANAIEGFTVDGSTNKRVDLELNIGRGNLSNAAQLIIKRMTNETSASTDPHEWYTFPKCTPVGPVVEKYSWDGQSVWEVEFHVYPSPLYLDTGTPSSVAVNTLNDTSKTWIVNAWQNKYCVESGGTAYLISSNTATALTLAAGGATPGAGTYTIQNYAEPQYGLGYRGYGDIDAW
jgi:hypothetical protein